MTRPHNEGYVLLLRGEDDKCAAISWRSKLISRVCKSAKSAETLALENAMDSAICIGRQLQGNPELAGAEMVRQLQKISRLMERSKKDQEKIEQWKQSLTYQSEILNRQKMEMETRIEQIEQIEAELEYLERKRQELETLKQQLNEQQRHLEEGQINCNSYPNLSPEKQQFIRSLAERLAAHHDRGNSPSQILHSTLESVQEQQTILNSCWQSLEGQKKAVENRQVANDEMLDYLEQRARELETSRNALETAKIQLQISQITLYRLRWEIVNLLKNNFIVFSSMS